LQFFSFKKKLKPGTSEESYDIADYSLANQHNTLQNDIAPQALKNSFGVF